MSTTGTQLTDGIWSTIQEAIDSAREFFGIKDSSDADLRASETAMAHLNMSSEAEDATHATLDSGDAKKTASTLKEVAMMQVPSTDNGDCLFESIASYMSFSGNSYQPSASELRELASGLIYAELAKRSPDERLVMFLEHAIYEHNESIERRYNEEKTNLIAISSLPGIAREQAAEAAQELEKLEASYQQGKIAPNGNHAYAAKVKNPGFFGNSPEMYVLAKELNISIQIYGPGSRAGSFLEMPANYNISADSPVCALLYTPEKRHFDLLIGT